MKACKGRFRDAIALMGKVALCCSGAFLVIMMLPSLSSAARCVGTSGDDVLYCSTGADFIDGLGGDDALYGLQGSDDMHGRSGLDYMRGNEGADTMFGGPGMDILIGDEWNDSLDDSLEGDDSDVACGMGGTSDQIDVYDGDGRDDIWDFSGATIYKDGGDTVHTSGDECP